jgi:hypothetical protein
MNYNENRTIRRAQLPTGGKGPVVHKYVYRAKIIDMSSNVHKDVLSSKTDELI